MVKAKKKKIKKKTKKKTKKAKEKKVKPFRASFIGERVVSDSPKAFELYSNVSFGEPSKGKIFYSLVEALYLLEKGKAGIYLGRKKLSFDSFVARAQQLEPVFYTRYCVYSDLRNRGYIIKTALKFGADFRVYERGVKPGQAHAKWIVYPVHESGSLTWHEFAAKNRVAHSTRKKLLIAIVDDEGDVTYYEIEWMRP